MILQLDVGNTRVKWRLLDGLKVIDVGAASRPDLVAAVRSVLPASVSLGQIQMSTVSGGQQHEAFITQLQSAFAGPAIYIASSEKVMSGVKLAYEDPRALGVDRALAMIAALDRARQQGFTGQILVLDAGSALTADWLNTEGVHKGGYIACGFDMMFRALNQGTERIRADRPNVLTQRPGVTTQECVAAGVATLYIEAIRAWLEQAQERRAKIFLTGGDAELILSSVAGANLEHVPHLVLDGLATQAASAMEM